MADLEWKRNLRLAAEEEEEEEGWKCDEVEKEETGEQESAASWQSSCRRWAWLRWLLPSDLRGQGEVRAGPLSENTRIFSIKVFDNPK